MPAAYIAAGSRSARLTRRRTVITGSIRGRKGHQGPQGLQGQERLACVLEVLEVLEVLDGLFRPQGDPPRRRELPVRTGSGPPASWRGAGRGRRPRGWGSPGGG